MGGEIAQATTPTQAVRARLEAKGDDALRKAFAGTITSHLNRPLVTLWHDLHTNQITWLRLPEGPLQREDRARFDEADRCIVTELPRHRRQIGRDSALALGAQWRHTVAGTIFEG